MWFLKRKHLEIQLTTRLGTVNFNVSRSSTGKDVFDRVVTALGLREFWFFGLSCLDKDGDCSWLDMNRKILDQNIRKKEPLQLHLSLKYYPENIDKVILDVTKRLIYLHMRDTICSEKLYCPPEVALVLASYCAQEQYGDYDPIMHQPGLLICSEFLPPSLWLQFTSSRAELEDIVWQLYRRRAGISREAAISMYLAICQDLDMYGQRHLPVTTAQGTCCLVTVDSFGLKFYSKDDMLMPKTAFSYGELRAMEFTRNMVEVTVGLDVKLKFVFFTSDTSLAKRLLMRCLGYRDLYTRSLSQDPNLLGYIIEGAAKSVVNGLSTMSRLPDAMINETKRTEAIISERLARHDSAKKAAVSQLAQVSQQTKLLRQRVAELETVQEETTRKQHMTIRAKTFYDFHTAVSGPSIPALARDHRRLMQEFAKLDRETARGSCMLSRYEDLLDHSQCAESLLRRQVESDFITASHLHVFDSDLSENDVCFAKAVEFAAVSSEERHQPWSGLQPFLKSDLVTNHELSRIWPELRKVMVGARQSSVDVQYRHMLDANIDKFGVIHALMATSIQDRMTTLQMM